VDTVPFWTRGQPGFRFTDAEPGSERFYAAVEQHRYALEPHILDVVPFEECADRDVLEVGCGVGTDGARFARDGARYIGIDQTDVAVKLARRRFQLEGLHGSFVQADATALPLDDASVDFVYSHGVIHHIPDTDAAVAEFQRVLRPGGTALVMVYHRRSLNYLFNILMVRRAFATSLVLPGAERVLARLVSADGDLLGGHKQLLRDHGMRYITDTSLFLSNNTDGPGNPLSKVYSRAEGIQMFAAAGFNNITTDVRYLNLRLYPKGDAIACTAFARRLERLIGWHLYITAHR
jgi:SAM-dependent methyltransferase